MGLSPNALRLVILWSVLAKSWLSAFAAGVLTSTTEFADLLKGLSMLGTPRVIVALLSFAYRYVFVLVDEAERMNRARDARDCGGRSSRARKLQIVGSMIASLFIRSYERAERVFFAMKSRGFDGEVKTLRGLRVVREDILFVVVTLGLLCAVRFAPLG